MVSQQGSAGAPARPPRLLVVDDEHAILDTLRILFRRDGWEVDVADGTEKALRVLPSFEPDVVLSDIRMPGRSGIELLRGIREEDPQLPVVLMTAQASLQSAIEAVNSGAFHYVQKPFANEELLAICRRAHETRALRNENRALRRAVVAGRAGTAGGERARDEAEAPPVGTAPAFARVVEMATRVAPSDSTVLITGESGTGKEVLARWIHRRSERVDGPFLSVNCGALPEGILESELFGHVKGAFTGAVASRDGLFVAARGGTLFLDEVAEMSPSMQVKFLRALQEREVVPVGASRPVPVDVRVVAASNRDLGEQIRSGGFRTDLYYRLNVIALHLPPLRERREDVPLLVAHILGRLPGGRTAAGGRGEGWSLDEEAEALLLRYDWPGNVRELENALERAAVLSTGPVIPATAFPDRIRDPGPEPFVSERRHTNPTLDQVEEAYIRWILMAEGGNKARAAEVLGIDPSTLYRKLARYGSEG